jgi:hypothetical protein
MVKTCKETIVAQFEAQSWPFLQGLSKTMKNISHEATHLKKRLPSRKQTCWTLDLGFPMKKIVLTG